MGYLKVNVENVDNELLEHEVVNQLGDDFESKDFMALSEMLGQLMEIDEAKWILWHYLSDTAQKNIKDGFTVKRY